MNDISSLIPRSKFDLKRAEAAVAAGYPAVNPILPQLLEWLQDYNWPVAHVLAPFLAKIGTPLIPHIRHVLASDDDIWKYWVLSCIVAESPEVAVVFRTELERYATTPTKNESAEGLNEIAQEILEQLNGVT
ncbi:MAG TPA: DUF5071 domain-containing protein [Pyrinomonadaceae bacterium]|nr:DUF5071 domain-containing protein [Pyrinomonadaceae bacterium]